MSLWIVGSVYLTSLTMVPGCDVSVDCPTQCACTITGFNVMDVDCAFQNLSAIPESLPRCNDTNMFYNISLQHNKIKELHAQLYFKKMMSLNVGFNEISNISESFRDGGVLESLRYLYLDHNNLTSIPRVALYIFSSLQEVRLGNNPWLCDCGISDFMQWLQTDHVGRANATDSDRIICNDPGGLKNRSLLSLKPDEICGQTKTGPAIPLYAILILVSLLVYLIIASMCGLYITMRRRFKIASSSYKP